MGAHVRSASSPHGFAESAQRRPVLISHLVALLARSYRDTIGTGRRMGFLYCSFSTRHAKPLTALSANDSSQHIVARVGDVSHAHAWKRRGGTGALHSTGGVVASTRHQASPTVQRHCTRSHSAHGDSAHRPRRAPPTASASTASSGGCAQRCGREYGNRLERYHSRHCGARKRQRAPRWASRGGNGASSSLDHSAAATCAPADVHRSSATQ